MTDSINVEKCTIGALSTSSILEPLTKRIGFGRWCKFTVVLIVQPPSFKTGLASLRVGIESSAVVIDFGAYSLEVEEVSL